MPILDSQGRSTDSFWKAKMLASWLHDPRIRKGLSDTGIKHTEQGQWMGILGLYLARNVASVAEGPRELEDAIERISRVMLGQRTRRRLIAKHLQSEKGITRADAMEALRRMGAED